MKIMKLIFAVLLFYVCRSTFIYSLIASRVGLNARQQCNEIKMHCSLQKWLQFHVGLLLSSLDVVKSPSAHPECSCSCCCCSSQVLQSWPYSHITALAQGTETIALNTKLFLPRINSSSILLHVTCVISSQSSLLDPLDHPHWSLFSNHQFTPVSRSQTALLDMHAPHNVEQASSYSSCSLSVWYIIITQLFSIIMLWFWTDCWHFSWRFPLLS